MKAQATARKSATAIQSILVVDAQPVARRGLTSLIDAERGLRVVAAVAKKTPALEILRAHAPDLAIVELSSGRSGRLALVRAIRAQHPRVRVLVYSMYDESVYAERALRAGAHGYVSKFQSEETLLLAIGQVLEGALFMSPLLEAKFAHLFLVTRSPDQTSPLDDLTDRQREVFGGIGEGKATREVAQALGISVKTVESHIANVKRKLMIQSGVEFRHRAHEWVATAGGD